jgi:thymidylate synthase
MNDIKPSRYELYRESIMRAQEKYRNKPEVKEAYNKKCRERYYKDKELIKQMKEILNNLNKIN